MNILLLVGRGVVACSQKQRGPEVGWSTGVPDSAHALSLGTSLWLALEGRAVAWEIFKGHSFRSNWKRR